MHIAYVSQIDSDKLIISEEESHHCIKVLRKKAGDKLLLTDGCGALATAQISVAHPKHCEVVILQNEVMKPSFDYRLHLAVAPPKHSERLDWMIEKATETGVSSIQFIETAHSERNRINIDRCRKIAISAMKQSKQWYVPEILPVCSFDKLIAQSGQSHKLIAWCKAASEQTIRRALCTVQPDAEILICIGPEGDFDASEVEAALAAGFQSISLGQTILRTETAALYGCMAVRTLLQS